jgi:hypothetical protein
MLPEMNNIAQVVHESCSEDHSQRTPSGPVPPLPAGQGTGHNMEERQRDWQGQEGRVSVDNNLPFAASLQSPAAKQEGEPRWSRLISTGLTAGWTEE